MTDVVYSRFTPGSEVGRCLRYGHFKRGDVVIVGENGYDVREHGKLPKYPMKGYFGVVAEVPHPDTEPEKYFIPVSLRLSEATLPHRKGEIWLFKPWELEKVGPDQYVEVLGKI